MAKSIFLGDLSDSSRLETAVSHLRHRFRRTLSHFDLLPECYGFLPSFLVLLLTVAGTKNLPELAYDYYDLRYTN